MLVEKAEEYYNDNKELFPNFKNKNDVTIITVSELIEKNYISEDVKKPNNKKITDYYIKVRITNQETLEYEVVG